MCRFRSFPGCVAIAPHAGLRQFRRGIRAAHAQHSEFLPKFAIVRYKEPFDFLQDMRIEFPGRSDLRLLPTRQRNGNEPVITLGGLPLLRLPGLDHADKTARDDAAAEGSIAQDDQYIQRITVVPPGLGRKPKS